MDDSYPYILLGNNKVYIKKYDTIIDVNEEVMRFLEADKKQIFRDRKMILDLYSDNLEKRKRASILYPLSYDEFSVEDENDIDISNWLISDNSAESEVVSNSLLADFKKLLTKKQLRVLEEIMLGEKSVSDYATETGTTKSNIYKILDVIREKAKDFFEKN